MVIKNLDRVFVNGTGGELLWQEVTERDDKGAPKTIKETPLTLRRAIFEVLLQRVDSVKENEKARFRSFELSRQINPGSNTPAMEIDLESEDITIIKQKAAAMFPTWTFGQLYEILEQKKEVCVEE